MFALVAAVILFLRGAGVLDDSGDAQWVIIGVAFWALHFAFEVGLPGLYRTYRRE